MKTVKLGDVCRIEKGLTGILKAVPGEYPMVVTSEERKSHNEFQFDDEAVIIPLVSSTGHGHRSLKRIHFQSGKFALGSILCAVIPIDKKTLSAAYLYRFLDLNRETELVARMHGMANVTLPLKEIADIDLPLPSLADQLAFVKKYQLVEGECSKITTELTHQQTLVKQLRQQLLQEAVQGKLSTDQPIPAESDLAKQYGKLWHASGADLLAHIRTEKAKLIKEKKIKADKPLPPITEEEMPFDLPEGWVWARLGEVSSLITDGEHKTPPRISEGRRLLSAKNIRDGYIDFENVDYISENTFQQSMKRCNPSAGDILIVSVGATIGRSAILQQDEEFAIVRSVALIRMLDTMFNGFVKMLLDSPLLQKEIATRAWGTAQPCLYINQIQLLMIPLPPLQTQHRLVALLAAYQGLCASLEAQIQESLTLNGALLQEVLREALSEK